MVQSPLVKPWHDDDRFWKTWGPLLFTERRLADAPSEVERLLKLVRVPEGGQVLDLCCGVGRHALEFARRGFRVAGVDRTRAYLAQARRQAKKERLDVEFVLDDMRRFRRPGTFDLVVNLFTAFGYFRNPKDDRRVAKNICDSLKPGGVFVMDLMGKERLAKIFLDRIWHEEPDGTIVLQEHKLADDWGWIDNRWILIRKGRQRTFHISHRLYSAVELRTLLKECGFRKVQAFGDFFGLPYDHNATRLVMVARK